MDDDILAHCGAWLKPGVHLVVLPWARALVEEPIEFVEEIIIFPRGEVSFASLNIQQHGAEGSLAWYQSAASGIDLETFVDHTLIAFPLSFDWDAMHGYSHQGHLDFIGLLSEKADSLALDFIRFQLCRLDLVDTVPAKAGQIDNNHMMAGVLLYNNDIKQGCIIGGAAFTHFPTRGLGLVVDPFHAPFLPLDGEVGHQVAHALKLYGALLEVEDQSLKFVQAISLLEFLSDPYRYQKFVDVKKTVARYVAKTTEDYHNLLARFKELTGNKDPQTEIERGYRTLIVHLGKRLREILPDAGSRRELFRELDGYLRPIIGHMIEHSDMKWSSYVEVRKEMKPFLPS
ncbi:hypothetical protein [Bradyrhizobium sp. OK095]|uniref:hypothetical protein n=1 Tax=Bradyrhizobium sp. OK095 TaxID=1882760 RepID=UPI0008CCD9DA|nr:hypothetical protein [Bradyrhizobium sp. OK095]SEM97691.1 hypothetical protein SAMN05443254_10599 [Bradyrhizobium sp. OK095]